MRFGSVVGLMMALNVHSLDSRRDCVYDQMHTDGGTNAPCDYQSQVVSNVGDGTTVAFQVDGAHLRSRGPVKYIKSKRGLSATDFLGCQSPQCPELSSGQR